MSPIVFLNESRFPSRHKHNFITFIRCHNTTFPWRKYSIKVLVVSLWRSNTKEVNNWAQCGTYFNANICMISFSKEKILDLFAKWQTRGYDLPSMHHYTIIHIQPCSKILEIILFYTKIFVQIAQFWFAGLFPLEKQVKKYVG